MNKKRNTVVLIVVFVLQLLFPVGMVSYTAYIEWGLENSASVYQFELRSLEWMHPECVTLGYDFITDGILKGKYCSVRTGADGLADIEITKHRPQGNYILSKSGKWFNLPSEMRMYTPKTEFSEDDYRWLYFIPDSEKEKWGWGSADVYFADAFAEVHIFKGHAVTKAVYIEGKTVEEYLAACVQAGIGTE